MLVEPPHALLRSGQRCVTRRERARRDRIRSGGRTVRRRPATSMSREGDERVRLTPTPRECSCNGSSVRLKPGRRRFDSVRSHHHLSPRVARSRRAARLVGAVVGRRAQGSGVAVVCDRSSSPCHAPVAKRKGTGLRIRSRGGSIPSGGSTGRHVPRRGDGVLQALCGRFDSDSFHQRSPVV